MRPGIGAYQIGVAMGFKSEEVEAYVWAEQNMLQDKLKELCLKTKVPEWLLMQKIHKVLPHWRKSKVELFDYLLNTTPTNFKYFLNLKDHQFKVTEVLDADIIG